MNRGQPMPNRRPEPDEVARRSTNDKSRVMQGGHETPRHEGYEKAPNPRNERSVTGGQAKDFDLNPDVNKDEADPKQRPAQR